MKGLILSIFLFLAGCGIQSNNGTYKIGIDPTWYPLQMEGKDAQVMAFSNEILQEIAKTEKLELKTTRVSWDNIESGLIKKQYDAMLSSKQPYNFYEKQFGFSDPYLMTGPVLLVPTNASFQGMQGLEIGVIERSSDIALLEKTPGIILRTYESIPQMLNDVVAGHIAGGVIHVLMAESYTQDLYQGKLKIATPPLDDEGIRVVTLFSQNNDLINYFNDGLKELKKSGKYLNLLQKWGLDGSEKASIKGSSL